MEPERKAKLDRWRERVKEARMVEKLGLGKVEGSKMKNR